MKELTKRQQERINQLELQNYDKLFINAMKRLFSLYVTERKVKKACGINNQTWIHLFAGRARDGVRASIICEAAKKAIQRDLS